MFPAAYLGDGEAAAAGFVAAGFGETAAAGFEAAGAGDIAGEAAGEALIEGGVIIPGMPIVPPVPLTIAAGVGLGLASGIADPPPVLFGVQERKSEVTRKSPAAPPVR